ncbi:MAG: formamidopyrimidine-DNA glycosylase [Myxococcaceae bacterium]|nr:formamidopyrimidine-DNA glycosylase [Myxococcaceae bacterium]
MPELPDVEVYRERLEALLVGARLAQVRVASPFVVRTFEPPLSSVHGRTLRAVRRLGKRVVFALDGDLFLVVHLMIAGRFHWKREEGAKVPAKVGLLAFDFAGRGTLLLTEASGKKRASLHLVTAEAALKDFDRGGLEVLGAPLDAFRGALLRESHTLKRALTDPRLFSGIGNAYSDEILHRARLSPMKLTRSLTDAELERLYHATRETLGTWTERLLEEVGDGFPEKVTAFREEMAVHGRFRQPCPDCGAPVQRIVYAENEANYCARCQTEGRLLSDRSLARLLKDDWPRTLEELEERRATRVTSGS